MASPRRSRSRTIGLARRLAEHVEENVDQQAVEAGRRCRPCRATRCRQAERLSGRAHVERREDAETVPLTDDGGPAVGAPGSSRYGDRYELPAVVGGSGGGAKVAVAAGPRSPRGPPRWVAPCIAHRVRAMAVTPFGPVPFDGQAPAPVVGGEDIRHRSPGRPPSSARRHRCLDRRQPRRQQADCSVDEIRRCCSPSHLRRSVRRRPGPARSSWSTATPLTCIADDPRFVRSGTVITLVSWRRRGRRRSSCDGVARRREASSTTDCSTSMNSGTPVRSRRHAGGSIVVSALLQPVASGPCRSWATSASGSPGSGRSRRTQSPSVGTARP